MGKHDPSTQNIASSSSSSFLELSTLYYSDIPIGTDNIVSSLESGKDGELFAVGSYTKRIKV